MLVLFYISLFPFSKIQATARKTQKIFPQTMYTCSQLATAIRKRIRTIPYVEKRCVGTLSI
jgi:uncharacterized membrane protein (UPF0182 family)